VPRHTLLLLPPPARVSDFAAASKPKRQQPRGGKSLRHYGHPGACNSSSLASTVVEQCPSSVLQAAAWVCWRPWTVRTAGPFVASLKILNSPNPTLAWIWSGASTGYAGAARRPFPRIRTVAPMCRRGPHRPSAPPAAAAAVTACSMMRPAWLETVHRRVFGLARHGCHYGSGLGWCPLAGRRRQVYCSATLLA
jgi:hypothetical protein